MKQTQYQVDTTAWRGGIWDCNFTMEEGGVQPVPYLFYCHPVQVIKFPASSTIFSLSLSLSPSLCMPSSSQLQFNPHKWVTLITWRPSVRNFTFY